MTIADLSCYALSLAGQMANAGDHTHINKLPRLRRSGRDSSPFNSLPGRFLRFLLPEVFRGLIVWMLRCLAIIRRPRPEIYPEILTLYYPEEGFF